MGRTRHRWSHAVETVTTLVREQAWVGWKQMATGCSATVWPAQQAAVRAAKAEAAKNNLPTPGCALDADNVFDWRGGPHGDEEEGGGEDASDDEDDEDSETRVLRYANYWDRFTNGVVNPLREFEESTTAYAEGRALDLFNGGLHAPSSPATSRPDLSRLNLADISFTYVFPSRLNLAARCRVARVLAAAKHGKDMLELQPKLQSACPHILMMIVTEQMAKDGDPIRRGTDQSEAFGAGAKYIPTHPASLHLNPPSTHMCAYVLLYSCFLLHTQTTAVVHAHRFDIHNRVARNRIGTTTHKLRNTKGEVIKEWTQKLKVGRIMQAFKLLVLREALARTPGSEPYRQRKDFNQAKNGFRTTTAKMEVKVKAVKEEKRKTRAGKRVNESVVAGVKDLAAKKARQ